MLQQPLIKESQTYNKLVKNVPQLQQINRSLRKAKKIIGGINDTKSFRNGLNNDITNGQNIIESLTRMSHELDNDTSDKMWQEAINTQNMFNTLSSDVEQLLTANIVNNDDDIIDNTAPIPIPIPIPIRQVRQQQQQIVEEKECIKDITMEIKMKQLEDEEERMMDITEQMHELKEAHTTLNELATETGEKITIIHDNTQRARDDVDAGVDQIQEAEARKKRQRKRRCWFLMFLVFMMAILFGLLAITGSFNGKKS